MLKLLPKNRREEEVLCVQKTFLNKEFSVTSSKPFMVTAAYISRAHFYLVLCTYFSWMLQIYNRVHKLVFFMKNWDWIWRLILMKTSCYTVLCFLNTFAWVGSRKEQSCSESSLQSFCCCCVCLFICLFVFIPFIFFLPVSSQVCSASVFSSFSFWPLSFSPLTPFLPFLPHHFPFCCG